ncbi:MAG: relaxase/mobilization nuclease domain-containing protein [Betaproteobacteria bacterium]|nr:relaxase/mobilization nuclease domain-containing protein [Betaproteobacteria bacterium]
MKIAPGRRSSTTDTDHPHIHIAALRITTAGEVVSESNDYKKAEAFMRIIEQQYGLTTVEDSTAVKRKRHSTSSSLAPHSPVPPTAPY